MPDTEWKPGPRDFLPANRCAVADVEHIAHPPHLWGWRDDVPDEWLVVENRGPYPPGTFRCDGGRDESAGETEEI